MQSDNACGLSLLSQSVGGGVTARVVREKVRIRGIVIMLPSGV